MERAATPGNLMETHIVVAAIASGLVGVIVVAMMIYLLARVCITLIALNSYCECDPYDIAVFLPTSW